MGMKSSALHSVALKSDGSVWAWGYNSYGNLGDGTTEQKNYPVQVVFGYVKHLKVEKGTLVRAGSTQAVDIHDGTLMLRSGSITTAMRAGEILALDTAGIRGKGGFNLLTDGTYAPKKLTYRTVNSDIAKISDSGVITAKKAGTAYVIVSDEEGVEGTFREIGRAHV